MKTPLAARSAMSRIRVFLIAICIIALTPRLSGDIILLSRLSDARASVGFNDPPPQIQTDFLPANLSNSAKVILEQGTASGHSTSNSLIVVDNQIGSLQVTGDGGASGSAFGAGGTFTGSASAKLVVLSFTLTGHSYSYALGGQIAAKLFAGDANSVAATAKLTGATKTIFEVVVNRPPAVTLSESGELSPGDYTFTVEVNASTQSAFPQMSGCSSSANFSLTIDTPPTPTPVPSPATRATNLSTRVLAGTVNNEEIGGFIINGSGPRHLLLRGIGPSLNGIVTGALPNPTLRLHGPSGSQFLANDNWRDTQEAEIIATGRAPSNDLESAIVVDLLPGAYTVILGTNDDTTGIALVEIYDLSTSQDSRLANLSTRANTGSGNDIMIAGLILDGTNEDDTIVVRGLGPTLSGMGVDAMADPKLELRNSQGALIAANNNWMDDPNQAAIIQAAGLALSNNLESAIAATVMPGEYTALLSGVNNGTGGSLVEIYDNPAIGPTPTPCPQCTPTPAPTPCSQCTPTPTPPPTPFTLEAEDALLTGCYRQVDPQASNGYRVDGIDRIGDSVKFVQLPGGTHLIFRYATPYTGLMMLYVNDIFTSLIDFGSTPGGWVYPFEDKEVVTNIPEGSSVKLQFEPGDFAINLDYLQIY